RGAQAQRRTAAVHGSVAHANDQHLRSNRADVAKGHGFEPVDADVDVIGVVAAGQLQLLALGCTGTDEHSIEALGEQLLHAVDLGPKLQGNALVQDHAYLFVQDRLRQPERGDVAAHEPAGRI